MSAKVGTKGQVVIEKAIRDQLGIESGWRAYQILEDGCVKIYFRPPPHNRSLKGALKKYVAPETLERFQGMSWGEVREEAWTAIADDRVARDGVGYNSPATRVL